MLKMIEGPVIFYFFKIYSFLRSDGLKTKNGFPGIHLFVNFLNGNKYKAQHQTSNSLKAKPVNLNWT